MIKGIIIKEERELIFIQGELIKRGISIFNVFFNKNNNILSWFENEDYQNTNIGFDLLKTRRF